MSRCLSSILNLTTREQAPIWAAIEDELLLDLDLGIGFDITETDPVRVWAAGRLESRGVVVLTRTASMAVRPPVRIARAHPTFAIRKAS